MNPASRIAIKDAMKRCEKHLNATNAWGTDIESYLTRFLVVFICGQYEREIERMVNLRADSTKDKQVAAFIANIIHRRNWVWLGEIKGEILGRFSEKYKIAFNSKLDTTLAAQYYENLVEDRMSTAHGGPVKHNISFKELKTAYKEADKVLTVLSRVLNVKRS